MTTRKIVIGAALIAELLVVLALAVPPAAAQFLPPGARQRRGPREPAGVAGIEASVVGRAGFDLEYQEFLVGALGRISLPRVFLQPTIQAGGDLTFFNGLTDRGFGIDALLSPLPGLSVGGGPAWRSSVFPGETAEGRTTRAGYALVAMLGGMGGRGRFTTGLEYRWLDFDGYNPQQLTLQFGVRLRR